MQQPLKYRNKKRAVEINETGYIQEKFIILTLILIGSVPLFLIPPIVSFNLCNTNAILNNDTVCSISFTQEIASGLIGYLPWVSIGNLVSLVMNRAYNLVFYGVSFLMTVSFILMIAIGIIKGDISRLKNIFSGYLLSWYSLLVLFVFKTYLIGYHPVSWLFDH